MRMRRKAWTEPVLDSCSYFVDRPFAHRGQWRALFPKDRPLHLEIGCGKGLSTVKMAHDNPNVNYIAVDEVRHVLAVSVRNTRVEYGDAPVDNLRYATVDAMFIHDSFSAQDGIERIYINFCNPWTERAKHHKRRLTHPRQLMQYRAFLRPEGEIWFKTDDDELFAASLRYLAASGFEVVTRIDDLHASGFTPNYVSEHERLYAARGKPIHFLIARMLSEDHVSPEALLAIGGKAPLEDTADIIPQDLTRLERLRSGLGREVRALLAQSEGQAVPQDGPEKTGDADGRRSP